MKMCFSGNDLYSGFNLVASIVPSSSIKSVLKGVKLEVKDGQARLTATDLEVLVKYVPRVKECIEEGSIVLPAARVNNVLREWAGNEEVSVVVGDGSCTLKSRGGYFKIAGEDAGQFPDVTMPEMKGLVEAEGGIISDMAARVIHSVSSVKARSMLCGVFLKILRDDVIMVTADSNRMSFIKRKVSNPDDVTMEGIVAVKCLTFLQRFTAECKGPLKVGLGESQVCFMGERGAVISQLIDGKYLNYEEIIPKGNERRVEVNKDALLAGVRMASFMTVEGYRNVKFIFKDGKLTLVSRTADVGEAELEVAIDYGGPDFEACFNPDYIMDALRASDSETVVMEFKDGESAVILRTGYEQLDVMMPIEPK